MIYDTSIFPGHGLGNHLKLGSSMFRIVNQLEKFKYKFKVIYAQKDYHKNPVMIQLEDLNIRLTFSNTNEQLLELIELPSLNNNRFNKLLRLIYNGEFLNEIEDTDLGTTSTSSSTLPESSFNTSESTCTTLRSTSLTFKAIYNKIFGPTYPGTLNNDLYILSYNGIAFKFRISNVDLKALLIGLDESQVLSKLLNWDNASDITCESIAIFKGVSWNEYKKQKQINHFYKKLQINLIDGLVKVNKNKSITIGTSTQQEVMNLLGPPDECFNKFDSKFLIHNHLNQENNGVNNQNLKFHNYFTLGIDILYDIKPAINYNQNEMHSVVKKIVLHDGGVTESLNFMKWNRCNWEITLDKDTKIDSTMSYHQLPLKFKQLTPVLLNRYESEFIDNDLDIIESPTDQQKVKDCKIKTWGQSKLYGLNRCILEVLNSNGCISTVTIY